MPSGIPAPGPPPTPTSARMLPIAMERYPAFPGFSAKMFEDAKLTPAIQPLKDDLVGDIGGVLWVLMGTIGMVLLIACANVATCCWCAPKAASRSSRFAPRWAPAAAQIARELLLESLTLGVARRRRSDSALAYGALRVLVAIAPATCRGSTRSRIDAAVLAVHAGDLAGRRAAVRARSRREIRGPAHRHARCAPADAPRARAASAIARATRWSSCRWRWRWCC